MATSELLVRSTKHQQPASSKSPPAATMSIAVKSNNFAAHLNLQQQAAQSSRNRFLLAAADREAELNQRPRFPLAPIHNFKQQADKLTLPSRSSAELTTDDSDNEQQQQQQQLPLSDGEQKTADDNESEHSPNSSAASLATDPFDRTTGSSLQNAASGQAKHHVGPVMGIFFKVWSLVKVTKARRQQKLRRQNSEDASQFHYIAANQFGCAQLAPSGGSSLALKLQQRRSPSGSLLMQDQTERNQQFRRAGSQPASAALNYSYQQQQQSRDRLAQMQLPVAGPTAATDSSGVSSATSSTLAQEQQLSYSAQANQKSSWASRIKRSASTVNQSEFVSKYRFRRDRQPVSQLAASQSANQNGGQQWGSQQASGANLQHAASADQDDDEDEQTTAQADDSDRQADEPEEEDEDIYSTPNDSIQSMPGNSQPVNFAGAPRRKLSNQDNVSSSTNQSNANHPITKSFSANNFNHLAHQNQVQNSHSSHRREEKLERRNRQNNNNNNTLEPSQFQANKNSIRQHRNSNGSRFFISSSSSEESNPSQAQQSRSQARADAQQRPTPTAAKVPLHFGVHYHEPSSVMQRPSSLLLAPDGSHYVQSRPQLCRNEPSLLSPSGCLLLSPAIEQPANPAAPNEQRVVSLVNASAATQHGYKKSPSLFEMSSGVAMAPTNQLITRFSSRFPAQQHQYRSQIGAQFCAPTNHFEPRKRPPLATFCHSATQPAACELLAPKPVVGVPNSISLHDCKLATATATANTIELQLNEHAKAHEEPGEQQQQAADESSEYKLTQMLLKAGRDPLAKDSQGFTAIMHAILSDNVAALKCLIEFGVNLDEVNNNNHRAIDILVQLEPSELRLEMLKVLIDSNAKVDAQRPSDGSRLLDRLIAEHKPDDPTKNKLPYIDCLLQNGAKLGSSTWTAAVGKHEIQLRLLRKICQDGYFLYKKSTIEAAVYRFEYTLKRISDLEQQISSDCFCCSKRRISGHPRHFANQDTARAIEQIKFQIYLGLSRCERKRRFFKRALEFAHLSILIDSNAYEGYYSKAHILKDIGELDDSLLVIDQTKRLVDRSIEDIGGELERLNNFEGSVVLDGCYDLAEHTNLHHIETKRTELIRNLEYLNMAKQHVARLKSDILNDKFHKSVT